MSASIGVRQMSLVMTPRCTPASFPQATSGRYLDAGALSRHPGRTEARSMDQLIPSLATLVAALSDCFHPQVFETFQALLAGWIACQGPPTLSEVWLATGLAARRHHDTAYAVFHSAVWEWDDLGIVLATLVLAHLVPGGVVWVVVDDTLCHKRGAKVAF